jgi:hypothetical protein
MEDPKIANLKYTQLTEKQARDLMEFYADKYANEVFYTQYTADWTYKIRAHVEEHRGLGFTEHSRKLANKLIHTPPKAFKRLLTDRFTRAEELKEVKSFLRLSLHLAMLDVFKEKAADSNEAGVATSNKALTQVSPGNPSATLKQKPSVTIEQITELDNIKELLEELRGRMLTLEQVLSDKIKGVADLVAETSFINWEKDMESKIQAKKVATSKRLETRGSRVIARIKPFILEEMAAHPEVGKPSWRRVYRKLNLDKFADFIIEECRSIHREFKGP